MRFIVRDLQHVRLDHLLQDDADHVVDELILPSHSIVEIEFGYIPRVPIHLEQLVFGCEGEPDAKPYVTEALDRFTAAGEVRVAPGEHSRDIHKHWHIIRNVPRAVGTHYVVTFKIQTRSAGVYPVSIAFVTNEIEGNGELTIRVEDKPKTRMPCRAASHFQCRVRPVAVPPQSSRWASAALRRQASREHQIVDLTVSPIDLIEHYLDMVWVTGSPPAWPP